MRTPQVSVDVRAWDRYPLRVAGVLEVADERGCGVNTAPMHPFFAPGAPEFAMSRGRQKEADVQQRWHALVRFNERIPIKYVALTRDEARERNASIEDLGMEWVLRDKP